MGESQTQSKRIESLKRAYVNDELTEQTFEKFIESALDGGPPYRVDWFKKKPDVRHKRYAEETVLIYRGEEYIVEGDEVRKLDEEIDRTIDVTSDSDSPLLENQTAYR